MHNKRVQLTFSACFLCFLKSWVFPLWELSFWLYWKLCMRQETTENWKLSHFFGALSNTTTQLCSQEISFLGGYTRDVADTATPVYVLPLVTDQLKTVGWSQKNPQVDRNTNSEPWALLSVLLQECSFLPEYTTLSVPLLGASQKDTTWQPVVKLRFSSSNFSVTKNTGLPTWSHTENKHKKWMNQTQKLCEKCT